MVILMYDYNENGFLAANFSTGSMPLHNPHQFKIAEVQYVFHEASAYIFRLVMKAITILHRSNQILSAGSLCTCNSFFPKFKYKNHLKTQNFPMDTVIDFLLNTPMFAF